MAIKIQTQKPVIPIEFTEDLIFEFEITDENIQRLFETQKEVLKELESIKGEDYESGKKTLTKAIDYVLGEGSFEKIYELSPSIIIIVDYFMQMVEGLEAEIMKRAGQTSKQKAEKYIKAKKKK